MRSSKDILSDTLYITMKVIDRSRIQEPEFYAQFEQDLYNLNEHIRNMLDKLDMADAMETRKAG